MKICALLLASMFKNEAKNIIRMLESSYKYIDYYFFQNNGSSDGTEQLVKEFLDSHNKKYTIYNVDSFVGFGWNRNDLFTKLESIPHNCNWILSMDCDETLQVDEDYDFEFDDNIHAYHVTAECGNSIYFRARLFNAKFKWRYNFDTAHETIYIDDPNIRDNFIIRDLPKKIRQIGYPTGESYSIPTKYLTDALILEERLNRQNTLLTDRYHFWYIAKSYHDAMYNNTLPLGITQQHEFARRSNYYFLEFVDQVHDFKSTNKSKHIDEMSFYSLLCMGLNYKFLGDIENAIFYFTNSTQFCPLRNEQYVQLVEIYIEQKEYKKALEISEILVDKNRVNPFPHLHFILNKDCYKDTGNYVEQLHKKVIENLPMHNIAINNNLSKKLFVVDNFYTDPFKIREYALSVEYLSDIRYYKGIRSTKQHVFLGTKEVFETILGQKIVNFTDFYSMCGVFQICTAEDPLVYHYDNQKWAAMIYLSPDAPMDCGTHLLRHKQTGIRSAEDPNSNSAFTGGFYDKTKFEIIDTIGSVFNRLVIFDSRSIHAASQYFGNSKETGRLTHLFFFD